MAGRVACQARTTHFMPIYEFACPKCRRIFSFLSKRIQPDHQPACPRCGGHDLTRQMSAFASPRGAKEPAANSAPDDSAMPDFDSPQVARAMSELERDMEHMDENNPRHMAHMMKKMKDLMPPGSIPKELDVAIKRLEKGEDPEKIEEDMGDVLGGMMGPEGDGSEEGMGGPGSMGSYTRDSGLYDY